jgi:hypothetical protein
MGFFPDSLLPHPNPILNPKNVITNVTKIYSNHLLVFGEQLHLSYF